MEKKRISLSIPLDVYDKLEEISEKRQPMSSPMSDILQFHAENHGNILTRKEHMELMEKKDVVIRDISGQIDDLNATVNELTVKIKSASGELGLVLDETVRKEKDFREIRDDCNNIASIGRVLQSTIDELREKVQGRKLFGRSAEK